MKVIKWVGLITALVLPAGILTAQTPADEPTPTAAGNAAPAVAPAASEVVKMAEAGTGDEVLLAYIKNSSSTFDLSADQILYLRDIGLSSPVISAMLTRDSELRSQAGAYTYDQKLYPPASAPETAPPPEPAPVEAPVAPAQPVPAPAPVANAAPAPAAAYVSSPPPDVSYFYSDLSPYGTWVQLDGVGWCWQPRVVVVDHGWRPYCDAGHWVLTDAGWFWQSDYSWGWAPFHYGRWYLHDRCGWVWMPDRVWGPAWVTWRYDGDYCGWAPLPPHADFDAHLGYRFNGLHVAVGFDFGLHPDHFTFIALRDFNDHDFAHHRLAPAQVTRIYNHTTIINNYVVKNNTVVNQGINVQRVSAATHTPFKTVAIRDTGAWSPAMANHQVSRKVETAVYRPQLRAPARPINMVAQKVDARHPLIQHPPVAAASPQRMASNAPVPPTANRAYPGQNPAAWSRPSESSRPQPTQRSYGSENVRAATSRSAEPVAPMARPQPERPAAGRSAWTAPSEPAQNRQYYPLRSGSTSTEPSRGGSPEQASPAYRPKGYYQAGETRMLPPVNQARPSDSRGQSSGNARPGAGGRHDQ